ncbi:hypothetical protein IP92_04524 [Pseudoduganella flava]|uniref:Porin n=1 Tax=Pseudoduganella flava TaxID=871742 RepID=A0A562PJ26_9BURK|nr:DUF1302 family protein [Pseudoduganella flava]QGZ37631.1 hypothetical protein GO485_00225 [Pseudoduganella flava]TWI44006.1 hypothetical protein IP92_04524 [Pseudoduganella flava]
MAKLFAPVAYRLAQSVALGVALATPQALAQVQPQPPQPVSPAPQPQPQAADEVMGISGDDVRPAAPGADKPVQDEGRSGLVPGARFGIRHELAARIREPHSLPNNRTSLRVEYEKYFLDNYYVQLDALETHYWPGDHRANARGETFQESTVRSAFLQYSKGKTSVKVGRQILVWGESDAGAITDVISPRNLSELFFVSLEESRLSQFMATVDQFTPVGDFSFFYVPRARFNKLPEKGTAYALDLTGGLPQERAPHDNLREYGMRWKKTFGSSDVAVMAARLWDNDYAFEVDRTRAPPTFVATPQRFDMLGMSFNLATEKVLYSGEIARKSPRAFLNPATLQTQRKDQLDTSLRAEYTLGNAGNHAVSLEAVNRRVLGWEPGMATTRSSNMFVLGWRNNFINDNLTANWLTVYNQTHTSFQHSLFLTYKVNGRVSVSLDTFYLKVKDRNSELWPYRGQNAAVLRLLYQF